jgi:hypothetical protein
MQGFCSIVLTLKSRSASPGFFLPASALSRLPQRATRCLYNIPAEICDLK